MTYTPLGPLVKIGAAVQARKHRVAMENCVPHWEESSPISLLTVRRFGKLHSSGVPNNMVLQEYEM